MLLSSVLGGIGGTPLVRLNTLTQDVPAEVWVKLESRNPGGSVKDRIATYMVEKALERGLLYPNGTLVEPTSGNTGIGLAMVAAARGLRCVLTMPESMSVERRKLLAALGAQLVLTPAGGGMAAAVDKAQELASTMVDVFLPNQFANPDVVDAHYHSTGPEIFQDLQGHVDAVVAGVGTGGTLTGVGRYLRERLPEVGVFAVEPEASPLLSEGKAGPHPIQGIGANFVPAILDREQLTGIFAVSGEQALRTARRLCREEGMLCGISSGANVWAALQLARRKDMEGKRIVTFVCDTGERYLSTPLFGE